mmetsp:Transcript_6722/g.16679  ORF Transcript_6722/g.16679 Transcript_6722/m.16679 type:complete len:397 (+) Transcript_6722:144-1334(+)
MLPHLNASTSSLRRRATVTGRVVVELRRCKQKSSIVRFLDRIELNRECLRRDALILVGFETDQHLCFVDAAHHNALRACPDDHRCAQRVHVDQILRGLHRRAYGQILGGFAPCLDLHRQHVEATLRASLGLVEGHCKSRLAELCKNYAKRARLHDDFAADDEVHCGLDLLGYLEAANQKTLQSNLAEIDADCAFPSVKALVEADHQAVLAQPPHHGSGSAKFHPDLLIEQKVKQCDDALPQAEATRQWIHQGFWEHVHAEFGIVFAMIKPHCDMTTICEVPDQHARRALPNADLAPEDDVASCGHLLPSFEAPIAQLLAGVRLLLFLPPPLFVRFWNQLFHRAGECVRSRRKTDRHLAATTARATRHTRGMYTCPDPLTKAPAAKGLTATDKRRGV